MATRLKCMPPPKDEEIEEEIEGCHRFEDRIN
jgi:hypothetical protein